MNNDNKNDIGDVDALRADNARLRLQIQDLTTYIDGRHSQWQALAERLQRERQSSADLETAIAVRDARIKGFAKTTMRLERRVESQRREIELLRDRLKRIRSDAGLPNRSAPGPSDDEVKAILRAAYDKLASMRAEQHRLNEELSDRNAYIDRLCSKLSELKLERTETVSALRRQRRIIDHIETEIRARLTRVAQRSRNPERREAISASIHRLDERHRRLADKLGFEALSTIGRLTLLGTSGDAVEYDIGPRTLTIGRGAHNDIRIRRHSVSREHARLAPASGGIVLEDLCSRNGVRVNDKRVARQCLRSGDVISIGQVRFRFSQSVVPFNRHSAS